MTVVKRRLIEAISDRAPGDAESLLKATQREVWPFLQQVRRLLRNGVVTNHPDLLQRDLPRQHPSAAIAIDDGAVFTGLLADLVDLLGAMAVLDKLPKGMPARVAFWAGGTFMSGEVLCRIEVPAACKFPAGLAASGGGLRVACTGDVIFNLVLEHAGATSTVGTASAAAGTKPFTLAAAADITCVAGDFLQFVAPGSFDVTAADASLTLVGAWL